MTPHTRPAYAVTLLASAGATRLADRLLRTHPPGGAARWTRTNHAGEPVTLLEGPAYVLGSGVGALVTLPLDPGGALPAAVAALGAGSVGVVDDLAGDGSSKGLRGHLSALRNGRVTTGVVKIAGLGVTGMIAADRALAGRARADGARVGQAPVESGRGTSVRLADAALGGAIVAGSANLLNLLDLRPGRALKATLLLAAVLGHPRGRQPAGAVAAGAALAALGDDLAGRSMLGDAGANAAGALLGTAAVGQLGRPARVAVLAGLVALTLASERVSFTAVIERTPGLREFDAWGRP